MPLPPLALKATSPASSFYSWRAWRGLGRPWRANFTAPLDDPHQPLGQPSRPRCAQGTGGTAAAAAKQQKPPLFKPPAPMPDSASLVGCTALHLKTREQIGTVEEVLYPDTTGQPHPLLKVRQAAAPLPPLQGPGRRPEQPDPSQAQLQLQQGQGRGQQQGQQQEQQGQQGASEGGQRAGYEGGPSSGEGDSVRASSPAGEYEEHLIPYVRSIVPRADPAAGLIYVDPPKGLLELGRRRLLTRLLREALVPYTQPAKSGGSLMPSRAALEEAGREDLVRLVVQAGGFLEVAQVLGFRARRRPAGYWDDEGNLDRELSLFVGAHWARFRVPGEGGEEYWYNQVTHRLIWEPPSLPELVPLDDYGSYIITEDEEDRVVPSRSAVLAAGRFDLDRAIVLHGGYREVAKTLDRRPAWPRGQRLGTLTALRAELRRFVADAGLPAGVMPSAAQLLEADRGDIYQAVLRAGGFHAVAARLRWRSRHRPQESWKDLESLLGELRGMLGLQEGRAPPPHARMPTHNELREMGRHDIRYALQRHGSAKVAALLGVPIDRRGRGAVAAATASTVIPSSSPRSAATPPESPPKFTAAPFQSPQMPPTSAPLEQPPPARSASQLGSKLAAALREGTRAKAAASSGGGGSQSGDALVAGQGLSGAHAGGQVSQAAAGAAQRQEQQHQQQQASSQQQQGARQQQQEHQQQQRRQQQDTGQHRMPRQQQEEG